MTTTVNDIEHIESQSLNGMGVIKVFFHPNVKIDMAIAQITAICQAAVRGLPPGITPPLIITYNASSVPILQLSLSSKTLSESQVNDLGDEFSSGRPGHGARGLHAQSLRRQNPPDHGGYRPLGLAREGPLPQPTWSTPSARKT